MNDFSILFVGGASGPGGLLWRRVIARPFAQLSIGERRAVLSHRVLGTLNQWDASSSEFDEFRFGAVDYVGLRKLGERDWWWFAPPGDAGPTLHRLLVEQQFSARRASGRGLRAVFPIKLAGGALFALIGLLVVLAAGALAPHVPPAAGPREVQRVLFAWYGGGFAAIVMGATFMTMQLVWLRGGRGAVQSE